MKVLIVDDEYFARKSIEKILSELDFVTVIGQAESGLEAIDIMKRNPPQVLLADVRMAGMDGIALCAHVKEHYPQMRVVIASGYADFEYAQQAIELNVKKYLLKPVASEELRQCMGAIHQEIILEEEQVSQKDSELVRLQRIRQIYGLLFSQEPPGEEAEQLEPLLRSYYLVLLKSRKLRHTVDEIREEIVRDWGHHCPICFYNDIGSNEIGMVFTDLTLATLNKDLQEIIALCSRHTGHPAFAGVSMENKGASSLQSAYQQAEAALFNRVCHDQGRVFHARQTLQSAGVLTGESLWEFLTCLRKRLGRQAVEILEWVLRTSPGEGSVSLAADYGRIRKALLAMNSEKIASEDFHSLGKFWSLEDVRSYLRSMILECCGGKEETDKDQGIMDRLTELIHQEYSSSLSLNQLAQDVFFMNPSYLSRLIKQKSGKNFSHLLLEKRMEKARQLLEESDRPIYEVAYLVGYNKTSHFIDTYKKYYGTTPRKKG